jgi:hypothetical protein
MIAFISLLIKFFPSFNILGEFTRKPSPKSDAKLSLNGCLYS